MPNNKQKRPTIRELAEAAQCSTETAHRVLKENPDAPRDDVAAFAEYIAETRDAKAAQGTLAEELLRERIRKTKADADKSEEAVKIMRGQYVQVSEVTQRLAPLIAEWQRSIEDRMRSVAAWGAGRSKGELQERLLSEVNEVAREMRDGTAAVAADAERASKESLAKGEGAAPNAPGAGRPRGRGQSGKATAKSPAKKGAKRK